LSFSFSLFLQFKIILFCPFLNCRSFGDTYRYDCYQNALAERINGILKQEFLFEKCNTGKELDILIKESINTYNNKRPHLNLKMKTPNFVHEKTCEDYSTGLIKF